jgi:hypothetical protein
LIFFARGLWRTTFSNIVLGLALFVAVSTAAAAQEFPIFEGFLGASLGNNDFGPHRNVMPGWHMAFALNPRHNLRISADFSGQFRHTDLRWEPSNEEVRLEEVQFLWGPEFTFRTSPKVTPFMHALFGVAGRHYYTPAGSRQYPRDVVAVDFGFASAFGGGADIAISQRWAIRVVQLDYVWTHLSHDDPEVSPIKDQLPTLTTWQHNYRISCGIVVGLGRF